MLEWLSANWVNIVIIAAVIALVVLAIYVKIGGTLKPSQYLIYAVLLISVALSFVTLVLLPFAPNGALLCTMILGIAAYCNMFYLFSTMAAMLWWFFVNSC